MEISVTPVVGERGTAGGAGSAGLNTEWKKLFKILAILLLSVMLISNKCKIFETAECAVSSYFKPRVWLVFNYAAMQLSSSPTE